MFNFKGFYMNCKPHFLSLNTESSFLEPNQPKFRKKQILDWIYIHHAMSPDQMSNISKIDREWLKENIRWDLPEIFEQKFSEVDQSTKLLLKTHDGKLIESVIMRYENRTSLCISSQVGCKLACRFCQTGKLGFFRHLGQEEIIGQYILAQNLLKKEERRISHVVFMGMGEPLDNYLPTIEACKKLIGKENGFGLSNRHVTVSTSGIANKIYEYTDDCEAALAVSLHAADDELRSQLMPINQKYNLTELKNSLLHYQEQTGKIITFEYILIKNTNHGLKHAKDLVKYIHGLRAKVNLIPFNSHPGMPWQSPDENDIREFQKYLSERSIPAPVRYSKGQDISAACGQLAAKRSSELNKIPERKNVTVSSISQEYH